MEKWLYLIVAVWTLVMPCTAAEEKVLRIGAVQPPRNFLRNWYSIQLHLSERLPEYRVELVEVDHNEFPFFARSEDNHFVVVSGNDFYEYAGGARMEPLLTVLKRDEAATVGSVVFFLKEDFPYPNWEDLKGAVVAVRSDAEFFGWRIVHRELASRGFERNNDFILKETYGDKHIVEAVLNGDANAGVITTLGVERLQRNGEYDFGLFSTIPCPETDGLDHCSRNPTPHSTRLYPPRMMAKTKHVSDDLAQRVADALLELEPGSEVLENARIHSFIPAEDYSEFGRFFAEMDYEKPSLILLFEENPKLVIAVLIILTGTMGSTVVTWRLNKKLKHANRLVKQSDMMKREFLANMSHEIRTPLNAVIGMSDLLLDTKLNMIQKEYAEVIRISGDALMGVITDVLDFSKIEAGHLELEKHDLNLVECLETALVLTSTKLAEKDVELVYDIDASVPLVIHGDSTKLRQILLNLLSNAAKFTEEGEIELKVSAREKEVGGHEIKMSVRDTGIGIKPDKLDSIFKHFTQADNSTTRLYGGTGLGLSISNQLCKLMGGRMWVESVYGEGSTFHFVIDGDPPVGETLGDNLQQPPFELEDKNVLVFDNNPTHMHVLCKQLKRWNLNPVPHTNSKEALEAFEEERRFVVMIVDAAMPGMDGIELIRKARRMYSQDKLPVIVYSSMGSFDPDPSLGISFWMYKPATSTQLYQKLVSVLTPYCSLDQNPAGQARKNRQSRLRVLVVEDNLLNQKVAQRMFQKLGIGIDIAKDGLEGVEKALQNEYDIVFMDLQMPRMDGFMATQQIINGLIDRPRPKIIAMTANAERERVAQAMATGMDDYLIKPIQFSSLREIVEAVESESNASACVVG